MKSKNIHNLVIEGPDGVGKTTLIKNLFHHYNYRYMCYHRGEISNYIFAKKYNRTYYVTQNNLPFLYILLVCSKDALKKRIEQRAKDEHWIQDDLTEEISKINDVDEFLDAAEKMSKEYEILVIDTTNLSAQETLMKVVDYLNYRFKNIEKDKEENYSQWNKMYKLGCEKLNKKFDVIDNQPYIDGIPANCETSLQNGAYETFGDKTVPNNLIFTLGYDKLNVEKEKTFDFHYIINSKILKRHEVYEYYQAMEDANLSCITSNYEEVPHNKKFKRYDRIFGDEYLDIIAQAKATVYSAREVEYMKIQCGRLYESIIANNIVFFDKYSDKDYTMLKNIYEDEYEIMIDKLIVEPNNLVEKYNNVMKNIELYEYILTKQHEYLDKLIANLTNKE